MDKSEIMLAGIAAIRLLTQENPDHLEYQEAAAQFRKAAEVCRLRIEKMEQDLTVNENKR